jgi:hypothetical protein
MRRLGLSCLALLMALTSAQMAAAAKGGKAAKKEKVKGTGTPGEGVRDQRAQGRSTRGACPPRQVKDKLFAKIDESYKDQLEKARLEPAKNDKIRQNLKADKDRISKSFVKFEGKTPGWEVSIIDEEFVPNNGESMLVYQENKQKRYFFFNGEALFKMFIAFDKEVVQGKSFVEFGEMMQNKFGKAQPVYRTIVTSRREGSGSRYLSVAFVRGRWPAPCRPFQVLRCLLPGGLRPFRGGPAGRGQEGQRGQGARRLLRRQRDFRQASDRDENDNVVDRITGKEVLKPGDRRGGQQNIKVPSPSKSGEMKAEDKRFLEISTAALDRGRRHQQDSHPSQWRTYNLRRRRTGSESSVRRAMPARSRQCAPP